MIHLSKKTRQLPVPDRGIALPFPTTNILACLIGHTDIKKEANSGWQRKLCRARIRDDASFARRFALLENKFNRSLKDS